MPEIYSNEISTVSYLHKRWSMNIIHIYVWQLYSILPLLANLSRHDRLCEGYYVYYIYITCTGIFTIPNYEIRLLWRDKSVHGILSRVIICFEKSNRPNYLAKSAALIVYSVILLDKTKNNYRSWPIYCGGKNESNDHLNNRTHPPIKI